MERLIQNSGDIRHPKGKGESDFPDGAKNFPVKNRLLRFYKIV
jgi:hypothetical protein